MPAPLKSPIAYHPACGCRGVLAFNIARFRVAKGLSQEQLGLEASLDRTYVSAVERGRVNISIDNIEKIAAALSKSPWELLLPPSE